MGNYPLEGVRVVGLTQIIAGPVSTRILASLGAEVITVEPPFGMGSSRTLASSQGRRVPPFSEVNRAKLSTSIDLSTWKGKEVIHRLLSISDILVQNYSPRAIRNLGLTYEEVNLVNPRLIMVSIPAVGLTGPWADIISFGPGCDALSGMCHLTGYEDGPPLKPGNFYADQSTAYHVALGVLAALEQRRRSGQGQHVIVPLRRVLMATIGESFVESSIGGCSPNRKGNRDSYMAPHNVYSCAGDDNWIAIAVASDNEWLSLRRAMEDPSWAYDARFDEADGRLNYCDEIDIHINSWTRDQEHAALMNRLQAYGVRAGMVLKSPDILEEEQYKGRNILDFVEVEGVGQFCSPGLAFRLTASSLNLGKVSPEFAQDTDYILQHLLSFDEHEVVNLRSEGVVF